MLATAMQMLAEEHHWRVNKLTRLLAGLLAGFMLLLIVVMAQVFYLQATLSTDRALLIKQVHSISQLQAENAGLQKQLSDTQAHWTGVTWNSCGGPCTMSVGRVRIGTVPDTFDVIISFVATTPITVRFMTLEGWNEYENCGYQIRCVEGKYQAGNYGPSERMDDLVFKLGEGCASYVEVFEASGEGVIIPNVSVRYNPAAVPTGVCAQS